MKVSFRCNVVTCYLLSRTITIKFMLKTKFGQDVLIVRVISILKHDIIVQVRGSSTFNKHFSENYLATNFDHFFTSLTSTLSGGVIRTESSLYHHEESHHSAINGKEKESEKMKRNRKFFLVSVVFGNRV